MMTIKVLVRRPVRLTDTQVQLLRFLAGEVAAPPARPRPGTFDVLEANGLIECHGKRQVYRSTAVGDDVLAQIEACGDEPMT